MNRKLFIFSIIALMLSAFLSLILKNPPLGFNSLFAVFLIIIFSFSNQKLMIFDLKVYSYFVIFIILSVYMGRGINFYRVIPFWDKILHLFFGFISYPAGICIFKKLKGDMSNNILKTVFALLLSFSLALFWEVWEFSGDKLFGLNSQNNSLSDTMWDMILACLGAILYMIILFCKYKRE